MLLNALLLSIYWNLLENNHQEAYDPVRREIDLRKLVPTKVKNNPRIVLPKARPRKEEAELMSRPNMIGNVIKQHKKENGYECNLTDSKKRGINKLRKSVKLGEIVVYLTDKSGKLCDHPLTVSQAWTSPSRE